MSLFQFGLKRSSNHSPPSSSGNVSYFIPALEDSGRGRVDYDNVSASVSELADPTPAVKKGKTRVDIHITQQKTVQVLENMRLRMEMRKQDDTFW